MYTCGDDIHATRDYIRLMAITCQSFGLDKKIDNLLLKIVDLFGGPEEA